MSADTRPSIVPHELRLEGKDKVSKGVALIVGGIILAVSGAPIVGIPGALAGVAITGEGGRELHKANRLEKNATRRGANKPALV